MMRAGGIRSVVLVDAVGAGGPGRRRGVAMAKYVKCQCGFELRAATEDAIVAMTQAHSREAHNQEVPREQVLALVIDVD